MLEAVRIARGEVFVIADAEDDVDAEIVERGQDVVRAGLDGPEDVLIEPVVSARSRRQPSLSPGSSELLL